MPIDPHDIDIDSLPRAVVGGLRPEPVAELFRRLSWDYAQLQVEYRKLKDAADARAEIADEDRGSGAEEPAQEATGLAQNAPSAANDAVPEAPGAVEPSAVGGHEHAQPDELVRFALAAANRTARELRESARADCEAMLRKVHARTARLERQLEQLEALRNARLTELDATLGELGDEIRSALHVILEPPEAAPRLSVAAAPPESTTVDGVAPGDVQVSEDAPPAPLPLLRRHK